MKISPKQQEKEIREEDSQISMGLQEPLSNKYYKVKGKFYFISKYFEIRSFFRNPWTWGLVIITVSFIAIQIFYLQANLNLLPEKVPLLTMYLNLERRLFDKAYLIALPATSALILFVAIIASSKVFYVNKILAIFTLILSLISSIVLTYGLIRIISLYFV